MPLILWTSSLSVQVESLDHQHQNMVQYINELHDSYETGQSQELFAPLLQKLMLYTQEHFVLEEKYMALVDFPEAERQLHIDEHRQFTKKVHAFQSQLAKGDREILMPLMKFLSDWLIHHIQETDKAYVPAFTAHKLP